MAKGENQLAVGGNPPAPSKNRKEAIQMNRKLKAIGLAVVAVFALSAVAASAAQASEFTYGAGISKIDAVGLGNQTLTVGTHHVVCEESSFVSTEAPTAEKVTIAPTYKKCKLDGALASDVLFQRTSPAINCDYTFTANRTVDTPCVSGTISITPTLVGSSVCTLTIFPSGQSFPLAATYDNGTNGATGKMDVEVTAHATGIHVTEDGTECGVGTSPTGEYSGNATVTGTNAGGGAVDVTWDA